MASNVCGDAFCWVGAALSAYRSELQRLILNRQQTDGTAMGMKAIYSRIRGMSVEKGMAILNIIAPVSQTNR